MKRISLAGAVFAAILTVITVVSLAFVLREPAAADGTVVEVYLNGSFEEEKSGPYGSVSNPFATLGDVRYAALEGTAPFENIDNIDRIVIRVTGDSRNSRAVKNANSTVGGSADYKRVVTQDHLHNTFVDENGPVAGANDTARRVMFELVGEQIGEDPATGDPLYPTIYYTSTSAKGLIQADDYTYSNISFKHMRWNWNSDEGGDLLEEALGVLPETLASYNAVTLYVAADKCIIGENVHFYGCTITGDGADREVEDTLMAFRGANNESYLNTDRVKITPVLDKDAPTEDQLTALAVPAMSTERYAYDRGREIRILSGEWTSIYLLGNSRHVYAEGTAIDLEVKNVTCEGLGIGAGGCEFLPDGAGSRLTVTLDVDDTEVTTSSGITAVGSTRNWLVRTANGYRALADHQNVPAFDLVITVGAGVNCAGKLSTAPNQTTADVVFNDEVLVDRSVSWTGDFTLNYDSGSTLANGIASGGADCLLLYGNAPTSNPSRVTATGKRTLNITGSGTVSGSYCAVNITKAALGAGSSLEVNVYGGTYGAAQPDANTPTGFIGLKHFAVNGSGFTVPVTFNVRGGTYTHLCGAYNTTKTMPVGELKLDIGVSDSSAAPVVNGRVCLLSTYLSGASADTDKWGSVQCPIEKAELVIHNGTGSDGKPVKITSHIHGAGINVASTVGTLSVVIGDKDSAKTAPDIADASAVGVTSCWKANTYSIGTVSLTLNDLTKTGTSNNQWITAHSGVNGTNYVNNVVLTINGGSYSNRVTAYGTREGSTAVQTNSNKGKNVTVTINGGTFARPVSAIGTQICVDNAAVTVNGGTFTYANMEADGDTSARYSAVMLVDYMAKASGISATLTRGAKVKTLGTLTVNGGTYEKANVASVDNFVNVDGTFTGAGVYEEMRVTVNASAAAVGTEKKQFVSGLASVGSSCKKLVLTVNGTHSIDGDVSKEGLRIAPLTAGNTCTVDEAVINLGENAIARSVGGVLNKNQTIKSFVLNMAEGSAVRDINPLPAEGVSTAIGKFTCVDPRIDDFTYNVSGTVSVALWMNRHPLDADTNASLTIHSVTVNVTETGSINQLYYNYNNSDYRKTENTTCGTLTINNAGTIASVAGIQDSANTIESFVYRQTGGSVTSKIRLIEGRGTIDSASIEISGGTVDGTIVGTYGDYGHIGTLDLTVSGTADVISSSSKFIRICSAAQIPVNEGVEAGEATRASVDTVTIKLLGGRVPAIAGAAYANSAIGTIRCYLDGSTVKGNLHLGGYAGQTGTSELYLISGAFISAPAVTPANTITSDCGEARGSVGDARLYLLGDMTQMEAGRLNTEAATLYVCGQGGTVTGTASFFTNGGKVKHLYSGGKGSGDVPALFANGSYTFSASPYTVEALGKTIPAGELTMQGNFSVSTAYLAEGGTNTVTVDDGFVFNVVQTQFLDSAGEPASVTNPYLRLNGSGEAVGAFTVHFTMIPGADRQSSCLIVPQGAAVSVDCDPGVVLKYKTEEGLDYYRQFEMKFVGRTLTFESSFEVRYLVLREALEQLLANGLTLDSVTVSVNGEAPVNVKSDFLNNGILTLGGTEYRWVKVTGIAPKNIDQAIVVTLNGTLNGDPVSDVYEDSVLAALTDVVGDEGQLASFRTAAQATLEYCQLAAQRFGRDVSFWTGEKMADVAVPDEIETYSFETGAIRILGTSLVLKDEIAIRFWADKGAYEGSIDDLVVRINDVETNVVREVNAGAAGYWTFKVSLPISKLSQELGVQLFDAEDEALSNLYVDSVANYAACLINPAYARGAEEQALGQAILNYAVTVKDFIDEIHPFFAVPAPLERPDYAAALGTNPTVDEMRATAVQAMRDMLTVQWYVREDVTYTKEGALAGRTFEYTAGDYYMGFPYTSAGMGIYQFLEYYDEETGELLFTDSSKFNATIGNSCASSATWGLFTVCTSMRGKCVSNYLTIPNGYYPLGDVTYDASISDFNDYTTKQIVSDNGSAKVYEGYALLQPADLLVYSEGGPSGGHTRMAVEAAHVVRFSGGSINPFSSYVYVQEQAAEAVTDTSTGTSMVRNGNLYKKYTFYQLYKNNYIAVSVAEFLGTATYQPTVITTSRAVVDDLGDLQGMRVECNRPMALIRYTLSQEGKDDVVLYRFLFDRKKVDTETLNHNNSAFAYYLGNIVKHDSSSTAAERSSGLYVDERLPETGTFTVTLTVVAADGTERSFPITVTR